MPKIRSQKLHNAANIAHSALSYMQHKQRGRYLEKGLKGKLRMYLEKISVDLDEERKLGMQLEC